MNMRIKQLRKTLDLTQQKFAEKIGVKQNTVAQYEMGRNIPIDSVIALICKQFNVNEEWLRNGTGEMFNPALAEDEYFAAATDLSDDDFIRNFLVDYWKLDKASQSAVRNFLSLTSQSKRKDEHN